MRLQDEKKSEFAVSRERVTEPKDRLGIWIRGVSSQKSLILRGLANRLHLGLRRAMP